MRVLAKLMCPNGLGLYEGTESRDEMRVCSFDSSVLFRGEAGLVTSMVAFLVEVEGAWREKDLSVWGKIGSPRNSAGADARPLYSLTPSSCPPRTRFIFYQQNVAYEPTFGFGLSTPSSRIWRCPRDNFQKTCCRLRGTPSSED